VDGCGDCGFEYDLDAAPNAAGEIVENSTELAICLADAGDGARTRPEPGTWSPLEYCCHVRDVLLVQRERALSARRTDCPSPDPMGRDERAEHDGYREQDPDRVARQLTESAFMFANVLDRLGPDDWERTLMYNYPQLSERSLRWLAVHTEHEVRHHLADVRRQLGGSRSSGTSGAVA
jgi:DinB superfamily